MLRTNFVAVTLVTSLLSGYAQPRAGRALGIDDLMRLRSIVDVQIAPDGSRVAYVVSTPNLQKNEHEAALFVVAAGGGSAVPIGGALHIFNVPSPRPQLR